MQLLSWSLLLFCSRIPPFAHISSLLDSTGAVGYQEDEEAFLEGVTNTAGTQPLQLAVKVRFQSSPAWSPAVLLKAGQHQAGLMSQTLACPSCCAAMSVHVSMQQPRFPLTFLHVPIHLCTLFL